MFFGYEGEIYPLRISKNTYQPGRGEPVNLLLISNEEKQHYCVIKNMSRMFFGYEAEIYPLRISKTTYKPGRGETVNLLLISNEEKQHYCVIKNMSRLLTSQTSKTYRAREFCLRCLNGFPSKESLDKHIDYCKDHEAVKRQFPGAGSKLYYKNHYKSMRVPIVVSSDFECFTKPIDTSQLNPKLSYTMQYQEHIPSSFCYYIECIGDTISKDPVSYVAKSEDDDVAKIFLDSLVKDVEDIYQRFLGKPKMIFTAVEEEIFNSSTSCHICVDSWVKIKLEITATLLVN